MGSNKRWWLVYKSRSGEIQAFKDPPITLVVDNAPLRNGQTQDVSLFIREVEVGADRREGTRNDYIASFKATIACTASRCYFESVKQLDEDLDDRDLTKPGPEINIHFEGKDEVRSHPFKVALLGDEIERDHEWELGWSLSVEEDGGSSVYTSKATHLVEVKGYSIGDDLKDIKQHCKDDIEHMLGRARGALVKWLERAESYADAYASAYTKVIDTIKVGEEQERAKAAFTASLVFGVLQIIGKGVISWFAEGLKPIKQSLT